MAIVEGARLNEGHGRKRVVGDAIVKSVHVLQMRFTLVLMGHDRLRIEERTADIAEEIGGGIDCAVVGAEARSRLEVGPAFAEPSP